LRKTHKELYLLTKCSNRNTTAQTKKNKACIKIEKQLINQHGYYRKPHGLWKITIVNNINMKCSSTPC